MTRCSGSYLFGEIKHLNFFAFRSNNNATFFQRSEKPICRPIATFFFGMATNTILVRKLSGSILVQSDIKKVFRRLDISAPWANKLPLRSFFTKAHLGLRQPFIKRLFDHILTCLSCGIDAVSRIVRRQRSSGCGGVASLAQAPNDGADSPRHFAAAVRSAPMLALMIWLVQERQMTFP
jgi:hypothetical protein